LIDEAHSLKNDVTDVLLTLLSPNSTGKNYIKMNGHSIEYDMSKINMILATTDEYCIFKPLLNRTEKIYFDTYNCQEMLKMLKYYLPKINITCDTKSLAHACRGRGRDAYKLAKNIQRYCNIKNSSIFGVNDWEYLKSVLEIYPLGLNKQELEVLGIIGKMEPISASNIAIIMRTVEENVINELEVRLRELNLISTSSKGRFLTEDGKKYLCYARDKKECRKECD
jgi:Holliday junction resolvasome RuvABC ATP-dependent DNA helicase subunit